MPTIYQHENDEPIKTNQFSVTEYAGPPAARLRAHLSYRHGIILISMHAKFPNSQLARRRCVLRRALLSRYYKALQGGLIRGLPGVFFFYDLSPIMVKLSDKRKSALHFLTEVGRLLSPFSHTHTGRTRTHAPTHTRSCAHAQPRNRLQ